MKTKIIILLTVVATIVIIIFFGWRYFAYGFLISNCGYSENVLPAPEQLTRGEVVVAKDAYLIVGHARGDSCQKTLRSIDRRIAGPSGIESERANVWRNSSDKTIPLTVEPLKKGSSFHITGVVVTTYRGYTDDYPQPKYHLILKDQAGVSYRIRVDSLGHNKEALFLSFVDSSQSVNLSSVRLLSPDSFTGTLSNRGKNSLVYTGELIELP